MRLIAVQRCPISGRDGAVAYGEAYDAFFDTPGTWSYRQDARTGHLWLDPRPADEDIAELYAGYYTHAESTESSGSLWERAMRISLSDVLGYPNPRAADWKARLLSRVPSVRSAAVLEVMRIPAAERGTLLDYGCGSGAFLKRMRSHGWRVVGMEPDAASAARVAAAEGLEVYSSIQEVQAQGTARFHVISMSHVIEHLPDPIGTITALRGLLTKGGRLIITTPNARSLGARVFKAKWRGLEPPRHFNVFTPRSLRDALQAGGYSVRTLRTDVRLARGVWFLSVLAQEGHRGVEISPRPARRMLKINGYIFQLIEAAARTLMPQCGEEIFCTAVAAPPT